MAAPVLTVMAVGAGMVTVSGTSQTVDPGKVVIGATAPSAPSAQDLKDRADTRISRGLSRLAIADPVPTGNRWTLAALNLLMRPAADAVKTGEVPGLTEVAITGNRRAGFAEILVNGQTRWVNADYLAPELPTDPAQLPLADQSCAGTSDVEAGLTSGAVRVYRAVCNNFPQITSYGGYSAHGEHSSGRAIDIMTSDVALGSDIAEFLRAHGSELDLFDVIWHQHIWTPVRSGEGWRWMPDRGSATANHYDHVHVSVN